MKRKGDLAVKNDKAIIQDAHDAFAWAKETEETSTIRFCFFSSEDYANAALFLTKAFKDIKSILATMTWHAVLPRAVSKI